MKPVTGTWTKAVVSVLVAFVHAVFVASGGSPLTTACLLLIVTIILLWVLSFGMLCYDVFHLFGVKKS